jgi:ferredoxin--NADP+ reductase
MSAEITFPAVDINTYKPKNPVEVEVIENKICTAASSPNFVRHITFDVSGTELENSVVAGQSLGILPPGKDERGKPHKLRLYSVSSPSKGDDGEGKHYSTTVKRLSDEHWETQEFFLGLCSNFLASRKPGDKIKMTGPSGKRFILPENPEKYNYVFVATGTGIAPFRGMCMELLEKELEGQIAVLFGCPYNTDLLYPELFKNWNEEFDNFHYLTAISREERRANGEKKYVQTLFEDEGSVLNPIMAADNTLLYICGLKGMEQGIYEHMIDNGLEDYINIHEKIKGTDRHEWGEKEWRKVKPGERMLVEVY